MKNIFILLLSFTLIGCNTTRHISNDTSIITNDSISIERMDSTSILSIVNDSITTVENTITTVEETITETVKDSTNNIVIDRTIERKITQNSGKLISSVINEQSDTTYINKEKTLETKDETAIQRHNEEKSQSNTLMYIFYIILLIVILYVIRLFKVG